MYTKLLFRLIKFYCLTSIFSASLLANQAIRQPTEIPGHYNVQYYKPLYLQNPSIQLHIYGTAGVSDWMLNNVSYMAQNMINNMRSSSNRSRFNNHHIFVITDNDPDVPYSSLPGHKNTGTVGFTILNQTIICAEAVDTLYPNLPPTWRAWDTPIHEFGHAIEHTLGLEGQSDSVFRAAESNYNSSVAREYFSWNTEHWFDASLSTNNSGQTLQSKRSAMKQGIFQYFNSIFNYNSNWKPTCAGRPDPGTGGNGGTINLSSLVGSYERRPIQNDWHKVSITRENTNTLRWTNAAGRSWLINYTDGRLSTTNNSPYGAQVVEVQFNSNNQPISLRFNGGTYTKVAGGSGGINKSNFIGQYSRLPVENGWHQVEISLDNSGELLWSNNSGYSWRLLFNNNQLRTGNDCPYGAQTIEVSVNNNQVSSLRFLTGNYIKTNNNGLQAEDFVGQYARYPIQNDWHQVTITLDSSGSLIWRNNAGYEWPLMYSNEQLTTLANSPYGAQNLNFTQSANGEVESLEFNYDNYTKID
ncbi:hypothetical protein [Pleionea sediminis]|uniref:hypothetical protein n=1 Tax=Pleionea sediminis TaxID=2569479 RepID=UPI001185A84C|nr:hypothetical protein [Pleionea sediminis]